jgi:hypothetical protein
VADRIHKIAKRLGAKIVGKVPDTGGGAFGAARLAAVLAARLSPGKGKRPGRPTDSAWEEHPKVPMSRETLARLEKLAARLTTTKRKISPMQVAAHLLEESVERL